MAHNVTCPECNATFQVEKPGKCSDIVALGQECKKQGMTRNQAWLSIAGKGYNPATVQTQLGKVY
jgi:hypothetical protein